MLEDLEERFSSLERGSRGMLAQVNQGSFAWPVDKVLNLTVL